MPCPVSVLLVLPLSEPPLPVLPEPPLSAAVVPVSLLDASVVVVLAPVLAVVVSVVAIVADPDNVVIVVAVVELLDDEPSPLPLPLSCGQPTIIAPRIESTAAELRMFSLRPGSTERSRGIPRASAPRLQQLRDETRPAGLVRRTNAASVVPVEVLVE